MIPHRASALAVLLVGCGGITIEPVIPPEPTLVSIQERVFDTTCTSSFCHDSVAPERDLDLTPGVSHANLVNVESPKLIGRIRVIPGDPDNSLLIQALEGTAPRGVRRMPRTGALPADVVEPIRQWIAEGALDN